MSHFDFQESFFDWSVSKILDKISQVVHRNMKTLIDFSKEEKEKALLLQNTKDLFPEYSIEIDEEQLYKHLDFRLNYAANWCESISFRDLKKSKEVLNIFIDLNLYLTVRRVHLSSKKEEQILVTELFKKFNHNIVLLGAPGAGKTTIAKYLCSQLLMRKQEWTKNYAGPLVIRMRDINYDLRGGSAGDSLYIHILNHLGIKINASLVNSKGVKDQFESKDTVNKASIKGRITKKINEVYKQMICEVLDLLYMVLIFDGFDEIPDIGSKINYIHEIQDLFYSLNNSKIFLTSRTGEFNLSMNKAETFEIAPLSDGQIQLFVEKWVGDESKINKLKEQINNCSYKDVSRTPINIAHLCAIFERYGEIPDKPKEVYKKIIKLVTDEWDEQRGIIRNSIYYEFGSERKIDFLANIAYLLTTEYNKLVFTRDQLKECYSKIHLNYSLEYSSMKRVLNEIESHNGLFSQCGADTYEFSHKSIQEYLTAEYLVRMPLNCLDDMQLINMPDILAVAASLATKPNVYIGILILDNLKKLMISYPFIKPFLKRLIDEKPDFDDNPLLALAIIYMYATNHLLNANNKDECEEVNGLIDSFINTHKNISISFKKLSNYYFIDEKFINNINDGKFSVEELSGSKFTLINKNHFREMRYNDISPSLIVNWRIFKLIYAYKVKESLLQAEV